MRVEGEKAQFYKLRNSEEQVTIVIGEIKEF